MLLVLGAIRIIKNLWIDGNRRIGVTLRVKDVNKIKGKKRHLVGEPREQKCLKGQGIQGIQFPHYSYSYLFPSPPFPPFFSVPLSHTHTLNNESQNSVYYTYLDIFYAFTHIYTHTHTYAQLVS